MTIEQLNQLEAVVDNFTDGKPQLQAPREQHDDWQRRQDAFRRAANPATVKALIGAVRKLAMMKAKTDTYQASLYGTPPSPRYIEIVAEKYIQKALREAGE